MEEKYIVETPWFLDSNTVLEQLGTNASGLSTKEAKERLKLFGTNDFRKKEPPSVIKLTIKQTMSPLILILVGAAVLTSILNEWVNTAVIAGAVIVNVALGVYREYQAEETLEKLVTYIKDRSRVKRDGVEQEIESSLLVPGDIIKLSYGSRVPADARILKENNLKVDEAILTGESVPESKSVEELKESTVMADRTNMVYAGTLVVEGFANAVVVATGEKTEVGKIAKIVSSTDRTITPIQKGVNQLAWYITAITSFIIIAIFVLGIVRGENIFEMLVLSAAVAVGAVPESLPIALTIILSVGSERIAQRKGVIRKLAASETLGSTTLVMTDKTGTLTKADMQLVGVHNFESLTSGKYTEPELSHLDGEQKDLLNLALENVDVIVENPDEKESNWKFVGHPFEINIAKASIKYGLTMPDNIKGENHLHIPFNSSNKFSVSKGKDKYIVMGAPDVLLSRSKISKDVYLALMSWIGEASDNGKRLIAIATLDSKKANIGIDDVKDIKFEGILSFFDPIRPEIPDAMRNIQSHGIKVVIITGDLKGTARSVASSMGWNVKDDEILTGEDLHSMDDEKLKAIMQKIKIYARVTPEDKLRVGKLYHELGEVVAMTGDGVNDSPALKAVDIGISLGSGSDVAQSAADLVLLDDNFQTISMAIDEGRRILGNIRKTFVYLMSNAFDEIFVVGGSLIFSIALPLNALQIIWVNLLAGSLPSLSFAYDEDLDKEVGKRFSKRELLTSEVKILTFGLGVVTSILLFVLYKLMLDFGIELSLARSIFFVCFATYVLVVAFSFRSIHQPIFKYNPFSNSKLNIAILIAFVLLIITMTVPAVRGILDLAPLPFGYLWLPVAWGALNILLIELVKWVFRLRLR